MPNTYTELRTTTLGTATNTVTFDLTGVSGYTDLVLVMNALQTSPSVNQTRIRVGNSSIDSGSNYSQTILYGNGTSALSARASNQTFIDFDYTAAPGVSGNPNTVIANFMNYSNTTTNKTILHRASQATSGTDAIVSLWRSTAAINLINVFTASGNNWTVGTTFSLYGIANADQGAAKATGGIITEDSQYWYHTFGATSAFIPKQALTADILIVAGGGGAGSSRAAGGGAGGLFYSASNSLTSGTSYTCTVGAGGAGGGSGTGNRGTNGVDSSFTGLTTAVGGGGGAGAGQDALNGGGSGGGSIDSTAATGTSGQGNNGGTGANYLAGAGGGGAGVVGSNATNDTSPGAGGNGVSTYSSWGLVTGTGQNVSGTVYYAGGGGGGKNSTGGTAPAGGYGGGGAGTTGADSTGTPGTANTGGGGGAGSNSTIGVAGSAGGSGLVIVRYAK